MQSPTQALLWELWRLSRYELLLRTLFSTLVMVVVFATFNPPEFTGGLMPAVTLLMLSVNSICTTTWIGCIDNNSGFVFRLGFTRPITTRRLVLVPIAFMSITSCLSFLVSAAILIVLFDISLPVVAPTYLIGLSVICFICSAWSPAQLAGKIAGIISTAVAIVLLIWARASLLQPGQPVIFVVGHPDYFSLGAPAYMLLGLIGIGAAWTTVVCVARQRCGERFQMLLPFATRKTTSVKQTRFAALCSRAGPWLAQFWFEMRRSGVKVLILGVITVIPVFVFIGLMDTPATPYYGKAHYLWLVVLLLTPWVYQVLGAEWICGLRQRHGSTYLSAFDAVRCLRSDQMILAKIAVLAATSTIAWFVMVAGCVLQSFLWDRTSNWLDFAESISPAITNFSTIWWISSLASYLFSLVATTALLLAIVLWLPLYPRVFMTLGYVSASLGLLAMADYKRGWQIDFFWNAAQAVIAMTMLAGCVLAWVTLLRNRQIGKGFCFAILLGWLVFLSQVGFILRELPWEQISPSIITYLMIAAGAVAPLVNLALAPLALASHRHR